MIIDTEQINNKKKEMELRILRLLREEFSKFSDETGIDIYRFDSQFRRDIEDGGKVLWTIADFKCSLDIYFLE